MNSTLQIIYSDRYKDHDTGTHPENARRMGVESLLREKLEGAEWIQPRLAKAEELMLVHLDTHIERIRRLSEQGGGMADPDTILSFKSYETARLSAGGLLTGVDAILRDGLKRVFSLNRPPGHHACPNRAMGFCLFNNIAIAARYAQQTYDVKKVLILDWDVHHGNGTQEIFYEDDSVYLISTHQHPHYPGTGLAKERGKGAGAGFTRNLPFPPATRAEKVVDAVKETLEEVMPQFKPDLLMISAGFDGHRDDPLGDWMLLEEHFAEMTREAVRHANKYCRGRMLSCLEGGYNLNSLAASCLAHCQALMEK